MNIQVADYVWLSDTVERYELYDRCLWSGKKIDGPHVVLTAKHTDVDYAARISIEHLDTLTETLRNFEFTDSLIQHKLAAKLGYANKNLLLSDNVAENCTICGDGFEDKPYSYWVGALALHVNCTDELLNILETDIWKHSDKILASKVQTIE